MHLMGVVLAVLGAWVVLAVPVALLVGRFLRIGHERTRPPVTQPMPRDSFGSAA